MATTAVPGTDRAHKAAKRYIYAWGEGTAEGNGTMKDLLGGKGAGLAEMTLAGLPTPPGFTITTEACNDYFAAGKQLPEGLWDDVLEAMHEVERRSGKGFGDAANPLLVSVRSGAKFSMPGMMDTVLNLGLNEETLEGLIALTGNERFGWDAYRRFIQMFGRIVMDVKAERFDEPLEKRKDAPRPRRQGHRPDRRRPQGPRRGVQGRRQGRHRPRLPDRPLRAARPRHQGRVRVVVRQARQRLPQQPEDRPRPRHGRQRRDDGVRQHGRRLRAPASRSPATPTRASKRAVRRVPDQRPGRGRGRGHPDAGARSASSQDDMPEAYDEFVRIGQQLEAHYRNVQDLEFTIERGRLYMLQTRDAKRTAAAAVKIAVDMVNEGVISKRGGGRPDRARPGRPAPARHLRPRRAQGREEDRQRPQRLAGRRRRSGRVRRRHRRRVGRARREGHPRPDRDLARRLPRHGRGRGDHHRPRRRDLARGGRRPPDRQAVRRRVGRPDRRLRRQAGPLQHHGHRLQGGRLGQPRRLDRRPVPRAPSRPCPARFEDQPELQQILGWADGIRRMGVWTNADKPEEAAQARSYGAQGIGLCRTEHMFREGDRLEIVRGAILVANVATRAKAKRAAGDDAHRRRAGGRRDLRRRDGQARGPPAGRLRGHLQGDGRPARRHPPHRPAAPRVPPQPRGAAGQGDPGRGARRGLGGGQAAPRDDQVDARAEPDARPARLPPRADDPGLREDPDPGDPQRRRSRSARPAATRSPRS